VPVEKIVEVEVEKIIYVDKEIEVEKIVYVETNCSLGSDSLVHDSSYYDSYDD
jgi:hypothetical protein